MKSLFANAIRMLAIFGIASVMDPCAAGELGDLLRSTLDHPAIQARSLDAQAAQSELDSASRRYLGSGSLSAERYHYSDEQFLGAFTPSAFANPRFAQDPSIYAARYSVPIDLFGAIAASRAAAKSNLEAMRLLERQEILMRLHATTTAYLSLQALQVQEDALRSQRTRVDATLERVRREVQVQLSAGVDLKLAESEAARLESDEVRLTGTMTEVSAALLEATGQKTTPVRHDQVIPAWRQGADSEGLGVLLARAQTEALDAQAREAHRSLLPQISAVGDYSEFAGTNGVPDAWSVGARFTVPIEPSAYRRASALEAKARAAEKRELASAAEFQREWTKLKAAYDTSVADITAADKEVAAREEVVKVQVELQRVGMTSMEDLLRQQRDLFDSQFRLANARARAISTWSAAQVVLGVEPSAYIASIDP
jgi:outer membrane protein TolC